MKTILKLTAVFALTAAFAGASADEAAVEEIVVVGQRAASTLDIAHPAAPQVTLEAFAPTIALPALEIDVIGFVAGND